MEGTLLAVDGDSSFKKQLSLQNRFLSVYELEAKTANVVFTLDEIVIINDISMDIFLLAKRGPLSISFAAPSDEERLKWSTAIEKAKNEVLDFELQSAKSESEKNLTFRSPQTFYGIPQSSIEAPRSMNPIVDKLIQSNSVFKAYPITQNAETTRASLPYLNKATDELSLWKIIKRFVGKNLANIALPIEICLPLSMLQMSTEFMEHERLFAAANAEPDAARRHLLVFAAVFLDFGNLARRARKPLNPILGETYELITPNFRLLAEQIQHHPPRCAFHAESLDYRITGSVQVSPYCRLSGVEMLFEFNTVLTLHATGECFKFKFPTVSFHNLLIGQFYLWLNGRFECVESSGARVSVEFLPYSPKPENNFAVSGTQLAADGTVLHELSGRWDGELWAKLGDGERFVVARRPPEAPNHDQQYYLSPFAISMNHLPSSLLPYLPPTDSRLRPDQRALEHGAFDLAEREKERLEEKQRARKKRLEAVGDPHSPLWFEMDGLLATFNERYWKCRRSGKWPADQPDLFS